MKWQRKRKGMSASNTMIAALQICAKAEDDTKPFPTLEQFHQRTINSLIARDWITELFANKLDVRRFRITTRGKKALKIFQRPTKRLDGICPDCNEKPKHTFLSGKDCGYCRDCYRTRQREKYRERGYGLRAGQLCPRCGIRERHITASGNIKALCRPCRNEQNKAEKKRKRARLLALAANGESLPPCIKCKKRERHIFGNTPSDYCYDCAVAYRRAYHHKAKFKALYKKD